jgi:hypothetical protein
MTIVPRLDAVGRLSAGLVAFARRHHVRLFGILLLALFGGLARILLWPVWVLGAQLGVAGLVLLFVLACVAAGSCAVLGTGFLIGGGRLLGGVAWLRRRPILRAGAAVAFLVASFFIGLGAVSLWGGGPVFCGVCGT